MTATRRGLQQVAVHVLAHRRHVVTGRFGLRPAPGGCATPAFGDASGGGEVLRLTGASLVVERGGEAWAEALTTLGRAADLGGVDLAAPFSAGPETPAVADPDAPLAVDAEVARGLGEWWGLGASLIDEILAAGVTAGWVAAATPAQLWPEHFDLASTLTLAGGDPAEPRRVNVGASPGDGFEPLPYLYVGPWSPDRPGDAGYWNAPFGAVLRRADAGSRTGALAFVLRGIDLLLPG